MSSTFQHRVTHTTQGDCATLDQLTGRCFRLQGELSAAYKIKPWPAGKIRRLSDDIARSQREIAARHLAGDSVALEHRRAA
jgi:hypothetical protein